MNIKNSNILRSWNMERIEYQRRYSKLHKDSVKNPEDRYILGQIHELKYILVSFFGLTEDELEEIQKDGFAVRDIDISSLVKFNEHKEKSAWYDHTYHALKNYYD